MFGKKLTKRESFLIILSIFVILSGIYYICFLKPNIKHIQVMSSEYQEKKVELETTKKLYEHIEQFNDKLQNKIPETKKFPELLVQLDQIIKKNNLEQIGIIPQKIENRDGYVVLPINLVLEGNYTQIKDFLKDIENFSRLLSIESFSIVFNNKTLTLKVEIKAYSLTNNEDVIPSFTTELGRPNPFAPVQ